MRTLQQVEDEIAALRAAIAMAWTERNQCTDLKEGRKIRLALVRRKAKLGFLLLEQARLVNQMSPDLPQRS